GRQEATLLAWIRALPDDVLRVRPVLSVHYAGALMVSGQLEGVEARLQDAERRLDPAAGRVVVDAEEFRRLPGSIAMYRAASALAGGDVAGTRKYARRVLDLASEDDHQLRAAA